MNPFRIADHRLRAINVCVIACVRIPYLSIEMLRDDDL